MSVRTIAFWLVALSVPAAIGYRARLHGQAPSSFRFHLEEATIADVHRAIKEDVILKVASAYEAASKRRVPPPAFGPLPATGGDHGRRVRTALRNS
jgi:hypothetical protein